MPRPPFTLASLAGWFLCCSTMAAPADWFAIQMVDDATGRGVPLIELATVNRISHWTDSQGWIAFQEPGLMDREVFFHVRGHGYEFPADGFGNRGTKLRPVAGGSATVKVHRTNIAERLYRLTGGGIYRDSVLLGRPVPVRQPVLNGGVLGQDTVITAPYRGRLYWFWGDTDRAAYPLGNFGASGATSPLPGPGGTDPARGVNFDYFTDATGFSRPMCPERSFGAGLKWIEGVIPVRDDHGRERLVARVAAGTGMTRTREWHIAAFDDDAGAFQSLHPWNNHNTHDSAHPFPARVDNIDYWYWYPDFRVRADWRSVTNPAAYEALTPLNPGATASDAASAWSRDARGRLHYSWRQGAERMPSWRQRQAVKAGQLRPEDAWWQLRDIETGRAVDSDRGSVCWNEHRRRWVWIGSGQAGEIWFAEADSPTGPWVVARRIVQHDRYNFYNPAQHPEFDEAGGRVIYFEGTYTTSFSGAPAPTPRYDYNQILYRLDLDDPRLLLPVAVYRVKDGNGRERLEWSRGGLPAEEPVEERRIAFFALPPKRSAPGLVPLFIDPTRGTLHAVAPGNGAGEPAGFALPAGAATNAMTVPLFADGPSRAAALTLDPPAGLAGRNPVIICRVWRNPVTAIPPSSVARPGH